MLNKDHICSLTGNTYYFDESHYISGEEYKFLCDTKMHYDIYQIILKYVRGKIRKVDAQHALTVTLDISDRLTYKYINQCLISEILNNNIPDRYTGNDSTENNSDMANYYTIAQINTIISNITVDVPTLLSDLKDNSEEFTTQEITDIVNQL